MTSLITQAALNPLVLAMARLGLGHILEPGNQAAQDRSAVLSRGRGQYQSFILGFPGLYRYASLKQASHLALAPQGDFGRCDLRVWPRGGPHSSVQRVTPPGRHGPRRAGLSRGNLCQFWRPSGRAQKVPKQGAKGRLPISPAPRPAERRSCPPSAASNRRQTAPSTTVGGPSAAGGSYVPQTL